MMNIALWNFLREIRDLYFHKYSQVGARHVRRVVHFCRHVGRNSKICPRSQVGNLHLSFWRFITHKILLNNNAAFFDNVYIITGAFSASMTSP